MEYFRKAVTILEKQWLKLTITFHANLRVSTVIYAVAFSAGGFCFLCKVYQLVFGIFVILIWTCWNYLFQFEIYIEYKLFCCPLNELGQINTTLFPSCPVFWLNICLKTQKEIYFVSKLLIANSFSAEK